MKITVQNISKSVLWPMGIFLTALCLAALLIFFKSTPPKTAFVEKSWPVKTHIAKVTTQNPQLILHGRIDSLYTTTLRAAVTAYVQSLPSKEGYTVQTDDVIVTLDPIDAELTYKELQADVDRIQAEIRQEENRYQTDQESLSDEKELHELLTNTIERQRQLAKKKLGSQHSIELAELAAVKENIAIEARELSLKNYEDRTKSLEAQLASAKAQADLAQLNITRTKITSPFNGIVTELLVAIGDRVQPNHPIATVYSTDALEIQAQVPADKISILQKAMQDQLAIQATLLNPAIAVPLTFDRLAGQISINEGGIDAFFQVKAKNPPLRLGQAVKVSMNLPKEPEVIALPNTAIYDTQSSKRIFKVVLEENEYRLQGIDVEWVGEILTGIDKPLVLIRSPEVQNGDRILITRLPNARTNLKVMIRDE